MEASNVKDMREAIETLVDLVNAWKDHLPPVIEEEVSNALNKAEAALAAPPRNYDKYATIEEATRAFLTEACKDPCENCTVGDSLIHECGIRWLFDKAKGETDGSK